MHVKNKKMELLEIDGSLTYNQNFRDKIKLYYYVMLIKLLKFILFAFFLKWHKKFWDINNILMSDDFF